MLCHILTVCIKKKEKSRYSVAPDVVMSGFPRILTKNQECAPILNVIAPIGKNPVKASKRSWFERPRLRATNVNCCESV